MKFQKFRAAKLVDAKEFVKFAALTTLAAGILFFAAQPADAVSQRVKNACKNDYFRHCPAYNVGSPQLRTCMTKAGKRKQLSRVCLRALIDAGEVPRKYLRRL